jgi:hypothetical protein
MCSENRSDIAAGHALVKAARLRTGTPWGLIWTGQSAQHHEAVPGCPSASWRDRAVIGPSPSAAARYQPDTLQKGPWGELGELRVRLSIFELLQ